MLNKDCLPYISIIIPVYNAMSTLSLCLKAIGNLDYPKDRFEIIVVDNGSSDGSDETAKRVGAKVIYETSIQSSYAARNRGIKEAKGELIAFTDSDCIVTPDWLRHLVKEWDDKTIGCFAGEIEAYQPLSLVEKFSDRAGILRQKWTLNNSFLPYTQTANSAYRREVFDKIGLFMPEMISGGDAEIAWRMQRKLGLKIKFIPEALVYHKHRVSVKGLYKQFKRYEHGKLIWKRHYPDYPLPSVRQRRTELWKAVAAVIVTLPVNLKKYMQRRMDIIDLATPFLRVVMSYGTLTARRENRV